MSGSFRRAGAPRVRRTANDPSVATSFPAGRTKIFAGDDPSMPVSGDPPPPKDESGRLQRTARNSTAPDRPKISHRGRVLVPRGCRPWTSGAYLTSTGLRELDGILGGGQPLGTAVLVEEDRWTSDLGLCLARYWCAEVRE